MKSSLFEFLAATKQLSTTPVPGDDSFTSALIYALEALVQESDEGRFTTDALLRKIQHDAPYFPKDQEPVLSNRELGNMSAGCIMLHPLDRNGTTAQSPAKEGNSLEARRHTLTLHFDYGEKPSGSSIETLGFQLNKIFDPKTLGVIGVRFGSLQSSPFNRAVQNLIASLERNRRLSGKRQRPPIETLLSVPISTNQQLPNIGISNSDSLVVPVSPLSNEDSEDQMSDHRKKRRVSP